MGLYWPPDFSALNMDWILGRMVKRSNCSFKINVKISDLDFADDAVNFAETLDILLGSARC